MNVKFVFLCVTQKYTQYIIYPAAVSQYIASFFRLREENRPKELKNGLPREYLDTKQGESHNTG
jgi:hypothetical protein